MNRVFVKKIDYRVQDVVRFLLLTTIFNFDIFDGDVFVIEYDHRDGDISVTIALFMYGGIVWS